MAATANASTILDVTSSPLVYLPSHLAHQITVATYIHIGMTAVLIWDVVDNLRNDLRLLFSFKFGIPTLVYFITRYSLLAYSLGRTVLLTSPVDNCDTLQYVLNGFLIVFVSSTTLFSTSAYAGSFFGIAWLGTVAMSGTFYKTFSAEHIGRLLAPAVILLFVNDVLVYAAITWKVVGGQRIWYWILGMPLPVWSRAVLQDSQVYYLIIVLTKGFLIVSATNAEQPIKTMFLICHLVLVNILSCRIYRAVRMKLEEWEARDPPTNLDFESGRPGHGGDAVYGVTSSGTVHYRERAASLKSSMSRKSDIILEMQPSMSADAPIHEREGANTRGGGEEKQASIYVVNRDETF
ncbi:hypothetical protein CPB84DRAFT_1767454 [Gymnopilus junonius]|uniref:Transmembrane protein n=1 Tax=Gymnopilus junonius TaxID=109634 RepID=A0A9P5NX23_GYMJU|nr:hypothetical protein CPB84DRAFT_1767454 [Gymnopilus junonius]